MINFNDFAVAAAKVTDLIRVTLPGYQNEPDGAEIYDKKKAIPKTGMASNDCLPIYKLLFLGRIYFLSSINNNG
jgi:hypothetical protein